MLGSALVVGVRVEGGELLAQAAHVLHHRELQRLVLDRRRRLVHVQDFAASGHTL